jgi:hypothetical protein
MNLLLVPNQAEVITYFFSPLKSTKYCCFHSWLGLQIAIVPLFSLNWDCYYNIYSVRLVLLNVSFTIQLINCLMFYFWFIEGASYRGVHKCLCFQTLICYRGFEGMVDVIERPTPSMPGVGTRYGSDRSTTGWTGRSHQLRYYVTNKKWNYILEVRVWERERERETKKKT